MNGIYLCEFDLNDLSSGVSNKIKQQIKMFNNNNINIIIPDLHYNNAVYKFSSRLPLFSASFIYQAERFLKTCDLKKIDFIYLRKPIVDINFIKMLKKIKERNKNIKIIMEIATYPYKSELNNIKSSPFLLKEKINLKFLEKYVDKIVTFSDDDEIFRIEIIKIYNGIDYSEIKIKQNTADEKSINIIAVSLMASWHGYDRLLKGLGEYYKNKGDREVYIHLVGEGKEIQRYQSIVNNYGIQNNVKFYGKRHGEELMEIYDKCNLAVETLGCHRKNIFLSSSLKSREYLAKGLPIITSCKIDVIPDEWKYLLKMPSNEENIDINKIIIFYDELYDSVQDKKIADEIRLFGEETCDINSTLKPIIDYIKENVYED